MPLYELTQNAPRPRARARYVLGFGFVAVPCELGTWGARKGITCVPLRATPL
jgi:hypothetical protein